MVSSVGLYVSDEYDRLFITVSGRAAVQCYKLDGTLTKDFLCYNWSGLGFDNPAGLSNPKPLYVNTGTRLLP